MTSTPAPAFEISRAASAGSNARPPASRKSTLISLEPGSPGVTVRIARTGPGRQLLLDERRPRRRLNEDGGQPDDHGNQHEFCGNGAAEGGRGARSRILERRQQHEAIARGQCDERGDENRLRRYEVAVARVDEIGRRPQLHDRKRRARGDQRSDRHHRDLRKAAQDPRRISGPARHQRVQCNERACPECCSERVGANREAGKAVRGLLQRHDPSAAGSRRPQAPRSQGEPSGARHGPASPRARS